DERHPAEHIGRSGDDASPYRAVRFEAVEGPGIVVEAFAEELQLLAFVDGIPVDGGVERGALREVTGMAGDAEGGFLIGAFHAIDHASAARRVGEPGIAGG